MFFLNLTLPEFLALLGAASGVLIALYLLDRTRLRRTVSTLRFFCVADRPVARQSRRRIRQPWSLVLQLLALTLLLLAIGQLRLGSPDHFSRDHVVLLDNSAWMGARSGSGTLMDQARKLAHRYVDSLPALDRVMIVRAGDLASPVTRFETDRRKLRSAIDSTRSDAGLLAINQAVEFARQAEKLQARRPGEVVFVGAGRVASESSETQPTLPADFRFLRVAGPEENCGLRKMTVRRSLTDPEAWDIFVSAKNYGAVERTVPMVVQFGGATVASYVFHLPAHAEQNATLQYRTRSAGWLEARLFSHDAFPADDRAVVEIPARALVPITVYSDDPEPLQPVFAGIPGVKASFVPTNQYNAKSDARIVVLDRFAPAVRPEQESIWLQPPAQHSPLAIRSEVHNEKLTHWSAEHPVAAGLRAKDIELENAEVFRSASEDAVIAETAAGPVIVAPAGRTKSIVFGFHPASSGMQYQLATPLLFANIIHWLAPDTFRVWELTAQTVGVVTADLETDATGPANIRVIDSNGAPLPYTVENGAVRFFTSVAGTVRVLSGNRELVYSLTLPQPGDSVWHPLGAREGFPAGLFRGSYARDIWQALAIAGGLCLFAEWYLFGRKRARAVWPSPATNASVWRKAS